MPRQKGGPQGAAFSFDVPIPGTPASSEQSAHHAAEQAAGSAAPNAAMAGVEPDLLGFQTANSGALSDVT